MSVLAIIPAAGTGLRMGGATPKQFLSLEGVPIFVHTLRKFAASEAIDEIFLGVRPEEMDRASKEIATENFAKTVRLVAGGRRGRKPWPGASIRPRRKRKSWWSTMRCAPLSNSP